VFLEVGIASRVITSSAALATVTLEYVNQGVMAVFLGVGIASQVITSSAALATVTLEHVSELQKARQNYYSVWNLLWLYNHC